MTFTVNEIVSSLALRIENYQNLLREFAHSPQESQIVFESPGIKLRMSGNDLNFTFHVAVGLVSSLQVIFTQSQQHLVRLYTIKNKGKYMNQPE